MIILSFGLFPMYLPSACHVHKNSLATRYLFQDGGSNNRPPCIRVQSKYGDTRMISFLTIICLGAKHTASPRCTWSYIKNVFLYKVSIYIQVDVVQKTRHNEYITGNRKGHQNQIFHLNHTVSIGTERTPSPPTTQLYLMTADFCWQTY